MWPSVLKFIDVNCHYGVVKYDTKQIGVHLIIIIKNVRNSLCDDLNTLNNSSLFLVYKVSNSVNKNA